MAIGFQLPNYGWVAAEQKLNKYPMLDEKEIKQLEDSKNKMSTTMTETQLYQQMIKAKLAKQETDKKTALKNEMAHQAEVNKDPILKAKVKTADTNDSIVAKGRELIAAKGKDDSQYSDQQIVDGFKSKYWDVSYTDILNGKLSIDDAIAGKTTEDVKPEWSTIKNIWEGIVGYAWGIPKVIAETGLLDKPLMKVANKIRAALGKRELTQEEQSQMAYSKTAAWSQVGWDPESKLANTVETVLTLAEVAGWLWGLKWAAKSRALTKTILPKLTPGVEEARAMKWLTRAGKITGRIYPKLTESETALKKVAGKFIKPGKTISTNVNTTIKELDKETDNLINIVKSNPKTYAGKEIASHLNKIDTPLSIKGDKIMEAKFSNVKKAFMEIFNKQPKKNAEWLLTARKEFDALVRREFPNLYSSEADTPIKLAVQAIRRVPNKLLEQKIGWNLVKDSLEKQHQMMTLLENLSSKIEKTGTTGLSRTISKNKQLARAAGLLMWWAAWGSIISGL